MTPDQAENALIAIVIVLAALCLMCGVAFAQEHGSETYRVTIGANVDNDCDPENEHTDCEDVPVFELQPEDYEQPPTPAEQWASAVAWREQGE